jgi:MFS family permease
MERITEKSLIFSRLMYIIEACLEYLISILVAGSFLATLTKELGFSDSLTAILSSIISLGCMFQLISLSIRKTRVKRFVIVLSILNQLLFMLLYVTPLFSFDKKFKIGIFIVLIVVAYLLYNIAHPKKINWLMSLVEDRQRGRFTANKEIVSLIVGIVFSFSMGGIIDHFTQSNQTRTAFIISAAVIFILMLLHSITMILTVEKEAPLAEKKNVFSSLKDIVKNKNILHVAVLFVLYYISAYSSTPFYGTYQINELGFSLKLVSAIAMIGSVSRILVSRFWGVYADKTSFAKMMEKCLIFLASSQVAIIFATPKTGVVMLILYHLLHGIALGGINSALINMVFDYAPAEKRSDSLALTQTLAGITGFVTTLVVSPLVSFIQKNNNMVFGLNVYAQQLITAIALLFTLTMIIYTRKMLKK